MAGRGRFGRAKTCGRNESLLWGTNMRSEVMNKFLRGFALAAVLSVGVLALSSGTAHAQRRTIAIPPIGSYVNQNPYITPYMTLNQYAYNTAVLGQAYSTIPPYMLGYNPYPQVINYGPVYRNYTNPYLTGYAGYNPYLSYYYNPYLGYTYP
jgi:hypothetical protein